ncbi:MAG: hypothetical protein Q8S53_14950, partial [Brevundimonas sp.]|uniref:hypothetical protein n=1 Tax=Brevundimonas sp. TaxID=1871086 RepID=UPI002733C5E6
ENARMGLLESFRARSLVYRLQLRFSHFMSQFTEGRQNLIMIGGFIAYRVLSTLLKGVSPIATGIVIGAWLTFALWSHLARGFSSFFLLFDRFARQALRTREFWEGAVVGGLIFTALGSLILGFALSVRASDYAALVCVLSAVVSAAAFTNDHHLGRYLYAAAAVFAGFGALYVTLAVWADPRLPYSATLASAALLTGVIVSWLRPLRVLYH